MMGCSLNLKNPKIFNKKLQWLRLYNIIKVGPLNNWIIFYLIEKYI